MVKHLIVSKYMFGRWKENSVKRINWSYMVVRRYYHNGTIEAKMIDRENFIPVYYPDNNDLYRQEFYPCVTLEQAVKRLCSSVFPGKKAKEIAYE